MPFIMTTHDQQVVKSGQTSGFIEKWTSDLSIDGKSSHKFICGIFKYVIIRLIITTHDQIVTKSSQIQGFQSKYKDTWTKFKDI